MGQPARPIGQHSTCHPERSREPALSLSKGTLGLVYFLAMPLRVGHSCPTILILPITPWKSGHLWPRYCHTGRARLLAVPLAAPSTKRDEGAAAWPTLRGGQYEPNNRGCPILNFALFEI